METSIYQKSGYRDRSHYLESMSYEYMVPLPVVETLADLNGEDEDFDGLVSQLEDYHEYGEMYYGDI